jgi:hypothetical protein
MTENITRLLSAASDPLSAAPVGKLSQPTILSGIRGQELLNLLAHRNGFYAFEAALLVRSFDYEASPLGILQWNNEALWMSEYKTNLGGVVFFAEDIFGMQFCIRNDAVNSFDPETGEFKIIALNLEDWSRWIWEDTKTRTGWPMAHFWQLKQGLLKPGMRLLPKVPFVLGGQFSIENLYEFNDVEGMRFRASIANQLRDCPDGSKVVLNIKRSN